MKIITLETRLKKICKLCLPRFQHDDFHFCPTPATKNEHNVGFQRYNVCFRVGNTSILAEVAASKNRKTHCNWLFHSQSAALQTETFRGRRSLWSTSSSIFRCRRIIWWTCSSILSWQAQYLANRWCSFQWQRGSGERNVLTAIQGRGKTTLFPHKQALQILRGQPPLSGPLQPFVVITKNQTWGTKNETAIRPARQLPTDGPWLYTSIYLSIDRSIYLSIYITYILHIYIYI